MENMQTAAAQIKAELMARRDAEERQVSGNKKHVGAHVQCSGAAGTHRHSSFDGKMPNLGGS
jgi:hypothetical protein